MRFKLLGGPQRTAISPRETAPVAGPPATLSLFSIPLTAAVSLGMAAFLFCSRSPDAASAFDKIAADADDSPGMVWSGRTIPATGTRESREAGSFPPYCIDHSRVRTTGKSPDRYESRSDLG